MTVTPTGEFHVQRRKRTYKLLKAGMEMEGNVGPGTGHGKRFVAIDQTRGLAIIAMILAHFGPGFYSRVGIEGMALDILHVVSRFATPTFIAIFGFTIAFAYLPKARIDPDAVRRKLARRSLFVLLCAVAVAIPDAIKNIFRESFWGDSFFLGILLNLYGVLFFYFLAILSAAVLIKWMARSPYVFPAVLGSASVFVGTYLGYDAWSGTGASVVEWFRLVLVSGKYAYLVNFGLAMMLVTVGVHVNSLRKDGSKLNMTLFTIGVVVLFLAMSMGRVVGWRTFSELYKGYSAPPQLWFLLMIAGVMMLIIALLNTVRVPVLSFILEHTGRNPLTIYVAHAFVLPAVELLRYLLPGAPDILVVLLPFSIFIAYWAYVVLESSSSSVHEFLRRPFISSPRKEAE